MGLMTLEDFRDELNHSLGSNLQGQNRRLDRWINRAYLEVAGTECWHFLKHCSSTVTVEAEGHYVLPDDLLEIISIADLTNKNRLTRTSLKDYHLLDRDVKGKPIYYIRRGQSVYFWPTPENSFQIELMYLEEPVPLLGGGDRTLLPAAFDQAIILFSQRNALLTLGEDEAATLRYQAAMAYLQAQKKELDWAMSGEKRGITVASSWDDLTRMRKGR